MRNDMCRPCFKQNPRLANYSCRVDSDDKLGKGSRYFGVELETEVESGAPEDIKKHLISIDELMGDSVIMKSDGSLRNGIEIVTKPATLSKQYVLWDKFLSSKHHGLVSWKSPRCGMHVHVGKDSLKDETTAKAVCFVNSESNRKFIYVIAGRKDSNYAKYKEKTLDEALKSNDRHENINVTNPHTVEFRLFKGTLRKQSVFKNIEFCDAIMEFCAQDIELSTAMNRASFIKFVKDHEDRWPHLMAFIMARWFGKATELSNEAGWAVKNNCTVASELDVVMER